MTPQRLAKIESVVAQRTYGLTVVLEDVYQEHNAAAVLRSCECFGVQHVHCVELRNNFSPSDEVAVGAEKWLDIHRYKSTTEVIGGLNAQGFRTVAMTLGEGALPLDELPLDKPLALVFGTELKGLSAEGHALCQSKAYLPMWGFTQSFNISVSVALSLQTLMPKLRAQKLFPMSEPERRSLKLEYMKRSLPHWQKMAEHLKIKA